ncbi:MAG: hypothetical protein ABIV11_07455 [Gemmatimonadaceae bacterium]
MLDPLHQETGRRPVASGLMIQSWPRLGIIGFSIAAVLVVYMVLTILISDRKRGG